MHIYPSLVCFSLIKKQFSWSNHGREIWYAAMPLLKTDMQPCTRWDRNVVFPKSYPALLNPPNTPRHQDLRRPTRHLWDHGRRNSICDLPGWFARALLRTTILRPPLSPVPKKKEANVEPLWETLAAINNYHLGMVSIPKLSLPTMAGPPHAWVPRWNSSSWETDLGRNQRGWKTLENNGKYGKWWENVGKTGVSIIFFTGKNCSYWAPRRLQCLQCGTVPQDEDAGLPKMKVDIQKTAGFWR